ncbi:MAG: Crp/Fnr family transcriptional regulator [Bacteroidales bacterium]|jgi:CRP/FNR family transcriptional regulator|nr:Crp/Fnr family transcriptional regulator [Bacteroidales bacterium]MDD4215094.1 Crp/Fnr family transcriptional regulator [Bacteroidales bacterium]
MQQCNNCIIKCAAVSSLHPEQFEVMENNTVEVHFKKGDNIFREGALSLNVAFLKSGIAKIHKRGPVREKILRIVQSPSYIGLPTSFGDKINHFSATAIVDTSVCFIDINLFRNFIYNNGKFAYEIIVELCENELMDYQRYTSQSQKQIPGMVAETLLCISEKIFNADSYNFPLTQSEFGDLVGTSRESVSRILSDFSANKLIEFKGKKFKILNKKLLKQISEKG